MRLVHIGLGKTATTSLQKQVFPELVKFGKFDSFNPPNLMRLLFLNRLSGLSEAEYVDFNSELRSAKNTIISFEGLADWNPSNWKNARDENLKLFGKDSTILITIRDPRGYLTSVYQQVVQEGHVITPQKFFVSNSTYSGLSEAIRRGMLSVFNVEAFDLAYLIDLYRAKFKRVIVVALPKIGDFDFLNELVDLSRDQVTQLKSQFAKPITANRAYSKIAMRMTLSRENLLNSFGLKSQSTHDFKIDEILALQKPVPPSVKKSAAKKSLPKRLRRKAWIWSKRLRRWRYLMQVLVNRYLPYQKYELPAGLLPNSVLENNAKYYQEVLTSPGGYQVF